jgi:hypothetical protein
MKKCKQFSITMLADATLDTSFIPEGGNNSDLPF